MGRERKYIIGDGEAPPELRRQFLYIIAGLVFRVILTRRMMLLLVFGEVVTDQCKQLVLPRQPPGDIAPIASLHAIGDFRYNRSFTVEIQLHHGELKSPFR